RQHTPAARTSSFRRREPVQRGLLPGAEPGRSPAVCLHYGSRPDGVDHVRAEVVDTSGPRERRARTRRHLVAALLAAATLPSVARSAADPCESPTAAPAGLRVA